MADNQTLKELEESLSNIKTAGREIQEEFGKGLVNSLSRAIEASGKLAEEFKKGKDITQGLNKAFNEVSRTQIRLGDEQINLERQLQKALRAGNEEQVKIVKNQITKNNLQLKLNEDLLTELNTLENINNKQQKSNEFNKKALDISQKVLGTQVSTLAELFTISGIFSLIIKGALNLNKYSVETGKALGYSAERSNELQSNFNSIVRSSSNINVNSISLNEAFAQLAQSTGYVSEFSEDALTTQIKLTKQIGLTGDEAAQIQRYSVLTGQSSEQVYQSFVKGLVAQRNQSRVGINFKATLAEAAKVSGQLAANLGYNPERIAKAVVQAKAFGLTLDQTKKTSESLLDFGSSIENELKAELLTGRQLNLERARAAALSGDQATLAEEIAKNVGTAADFAKMNVLQQKSLAESVGMTADELGETLRKREEALKSGKSLAQVTEEEATKALERQAIQDKFNAGVEKLQSLFGGLLAGPLGTFVDMLSSSLDIINKMGPLLVGIATTWGVIKLTNGAIAISQLIQKEGLMAQIAKLPALIGLKSTEAAIATEGAVASISAASAATLGVGAVAIIAGIAAAVGAMKSMKDGIIGPGGETVVSGPKGSIKLDKNDSLIAGTNLFDKGGNNQTISPSIDLSPMISAINEVKASVDRLYSKDSTISMDGKRVGTTLTQGSYKVA